MNQFLVITGFKDASTRRQHTDDIYLALWIPTLSFGAKADMFISEN